MGEAFDRSGHFLGGVQAETKREVFDKLMERHPTAAEIRIRELSGTSAEMPRYKCHKEVWALKIQDISDPTEAGNESDGSRLLHPVEAGYGPVAVDAAYMRKHQPQIGGYYVVYKDGYRSFSPAEAFDEGYTRA